MLTNKFNIIILFISICIVLTGCAHKDTNKLSIGYSLTSAPYSFYNNNNELEGFDIDIIKAIIKRLKVDYDLTEMPFKELIIKINMGHIDMAISNQYITEQRKELVAFSNPYGSSCSAMAVNTNSKITSLKNIKKHNVILGTKQGTTHARYLLSSEYKDMTQLYPTQNDLMLAFMTNRIEGIITDKRILVSLQDEKKMNMRLLDGCIGKLEVFGITMKKDNKALQTKVNNALEEMKKDGTYDQIAQKWFKANPLEEYDDYIKKNGKTEE